ncbi:hypothetical protein [Mycolicibacterium palauense]|nr:hypothetical protein [Mycolicibacterium palauense]
MTNGEAITTHAIPKLLHYNDKRPKAMAAGHPAQPNTSKPVV